MDSSHHHLWSCSLLRSGKGVVYFTKIVKNAFTFTRNRLFDSILGVNPIFLEGLRYSSF